MRVKGQTALLGTFPDFPTTGLRTIVDSGTTLNLIPPDMFNNILNVMIGVQSGLPQEFFTTQNPGDGTFARNVDDATIARFPTLQVQLRSTTGQTFWLDMTPQTYFKEWTNGTRIFGFRPTQDLVQFRPLIIMGQVFMENHYVSFDRANSRVGFGDNSALCGT
jgi:hypothetical protein